MLVTLPFGIDTRLQKFSDQPPVLGGPGIRSGVEQRLRASSSPGTAFSSFSGKGSQTRR